MGSEEAGHGECGKKPILHPQKVQHIPEIVQLRCGSHHSLACSKAGDVYVWGCGISYQLGNRPRDFENPGDANDDPDFELKPYQLSSKQLADRFVLTAHGGAQHSVELAWTGEYCKPPQLGATGTRDREKVMVLACNPSVRN